MKKCPQCGEEYPRGSFCGSCGSALEEVEERGGDPLVETIFHGRYEVLERLGAGGFGTVYRVNDRTLGSLVALKVVHPHVLTDAKQIQRFRREAHLMRSLGLRSPHIPTLFHYDTEPDRKLTYFTLELIPGKTLKEILAGDGPLPQERAVAILRQICEALEVAHREDPPVIHRDLKPDNVMVVRRDGRDEIKILDFGIAKIVGDKTVTVEGAIGSAGYIAPEYLDDKPVDGRTDLFAAGVILYNMVTGREPWLGKRIGEPVSRGAELNMVQRTLKEPPRPPGEFVPDLAPELERVIYRLLEKRPADRFGSASELDDALERVQHLVGAPAGGQLRVTSQPSGARVRLIRSGEVLHEGLTPWEVDEIPPDRYDLQLEARKHQPVTDSVVIRSNQVTRLNVSLERKVSAAETALSATADAVGRSGARLKSAASAASGRTAAAFKTLGAGIAGGWRTTAAAFGSGAEGIAAVARGAARGSADIVAGGLRGLGRLGAAVAAGAAGLYRTTVEGIRRAISAFGRGVAAFARAISALPRPTARGVAVAGLGAVLIGGAAYLAVARPAIPLPDVGALLSGLFSSPEAGPGAVEEITRAELLTRVRQGAIGHVTLEGNALLAAAGAEGDPRYRLALVGGGFQELMSELREREVRVEATGSSTVQVRARRAGTDETVPDPVISLRSPEAECRSCASGVHTLPAAWYGLSAESGDWLVDSAFLRNAEDGEPKEELFFGDSARVFLPPETAVILELALSPVPDDVATLLEEARQAAAAGRWDDAYGTWRRAGQAGADVAELRSIEDRIRRHFRERASEPLQRADYSGALAAANECLRRFSEDEECRATLEAARSGAAEAEVAGAENRFESLLAAGDLRGALEAGRACRSRFPDSEACRNAESRVRERAQTSASRALAAGDYQRALREADDCLALFDGSGECARVARAAEEALADDEPAALDLGGVWRLSETLQAESAGSIRRCLFYRSPGEPVRIEHDGAAVSGRSQRPLEEICEADAPLEARVLEWRVESGSIDAADRLTLRVRRAPSDGEGSRMATVCTYVSDPLQPGATEITGRVSCGTFRGTFTLRLEGG